MSEQSQPKKSLFQFYQELPGLNINVPQLANSSIEVVLADRFKRLQGIEFVFNWGSPREFEGKTIQDFESPFLEHIYQLVAGRTLTDAEIKPYIGDRSKVKKALGDAKELFTQARYAVDRGQNDGDTRSDLFEVLNKCTICFEQAIRNWGNREPYRNLDSTLKNLTASTCYERLGVMYNYFVVGSYHDIQASVRTFEVELRQEIILTVLETESDIDQKEEVVGYLRKAKINLNLILDELEIRQMRQSHPKQESDARLTGYYRGCENFFDQALTLWKAS